MILWLLFWSFYTWVHCIFYKHTHGLVGSSINFSIVNTAYDLKVQVQVDFVFFFVIFIWLSGFLLLIYRYQFIIYDTFIFVSVLSLIILDFINEFHKQHIFRFWNWLYIRNAVLLFMICHKSSLPISSPCSS